MPQGKTPLIAEDSTRPSTFGRRPPHRPPHNVLRGPARWARRRSAPRRRIIISPLATTRRRSPTRRPCWPARYGTPAARSGLSRAGHPAGGVGHARRGELPAEDANPAGRGEDRRRSPRRPGHPARNRPGRGSRRSPGPRAENLVDMANLLTARRGDPVKVEGVSDPADPDRDLYENGGLLPGPDGRAATSRMARRRVLTCEGAFDLADRSGWLAHGVRVDLEVGGLGGEPYLAARIKR